MRKRALRRKVIRRILLCLIVVILITWTTCIARARLGVYQYSDTVIHSVSSGETIWSIAREYSSDKHDVRKVIGIMQVLNPSLNPTIHAGDPIEVPLFHNMEEIG